MEIGIFASFKSICRDLDSEPSPFCQQLPAVSRPVVSHASVSTSQLIAIPGDSREVTCEPDYVISGTSSQEYTITCQDDGNWTTGPDCVGKTTFTSQITIWGMLEWPHSRPFCSKRELPFFYTKMYYYRTIGIMCLFSTNKKLTFVHKPYRSAIYCNINEDHFHTDVILSFMFAVLSRKNKLVLTFCLNSCWYKNTVGCTFKLFWKFSH